jgi:hypothetical protein
MLQRSKSLLVAASLIVSGFTFGAATTTNANSSHSKIVGSWYAVTEGAPYDDHVLQFDDSGNVLINNPSRVQEQPDGTGTNDSVGVGSWKYDHGVYVFNFMELNAVQGTNIVAPQTEIKFWVTFDQNGLWSGTWSGGGHTGTIHAVRKITV